MKLKQKIQHSFSPESLRNDEDKAKHYTELNYSTLMALFFKCNVAPVSAASSSDISFCDD
jgi:hypothetical protein